MSVLGDQLGQPLQQRTTLLETLPPAVLAGFAGLMPTARIATTPATARRLATRISISQVKKTYKLVRLSVGNLTVRRMFLQVKIDSFREKVAGQTRPEGVAARCLQSLSNPYTVSKNRPVRAKGR